jgi:cytochrome P450
VSHRSDRRAQKETPFDPGVNALVSSESSTTAQRMAFETTLATLSGLVDPYPAYARLRAEDPIHRTLEGLWILTRYGDVAAVLRDPRFGREGFERYFGVDPELGANGSCPGRAGSHGDAGGSRQSMLFRDPPHHTRLRETVSHAFAPRSVQVVRPLIERLVTTLLARVDGASIVDVVAALAEPLPTAVIGALLGIPEAPRAILRAWSGIVARSLDALPIPQDRALIADGQTARRMLGGYVRELIAVRRVAPGPDLVSSLIAIAELDGLLSERELVATVVLLMAAATETTTSLIGTTVWALLRHPEVLARVRTAPCRLPEVIEEALRWESPVQRTWRIAKTDVEVAGHRIPAGALVVLVIGAANRDPARFPDPDRFDPARRPAGHLAFGAGAHACLGAALARLETEVALDALLRRWPNLRLAHQTPSWRPAATLRSLADLRVRR